MSGGTAGTNNKYQQYYLDPGGGRYQYEASQHGDLLYTAISMGKTNWQDEVAKQNYIAMAEKNHV